MGWKRRSSAASFSRYLRYSSSVVAPMVCSSPRASMGLRIEAASIAPSAAPAPTSVCSSSRNRMMSPRVRISFSTFFSRSSKSPRYLERDNHLREALHDRGLAHAGLADQGRVVLGAPGQHLHDPLDFLLPPDHRVELALPRGRGQVPAELVEDQGGGGSGLGRGAGRCGLLALVAVQQLDYLLADPAQVRTQLDQ